MSYLTDGPDDRIEAVQLAGVLKTLVPLMGHTHPNVQTPVLRAVGNMVTGNNEQVLAYLMMLVSSIKFVLTTMLLQTQRVLEAGVLPMLRNLLQSSRAAIVKEAAWAACNILAGTSEQRDMFISADMLGPLIQVLKHDEHK